MTRQTISSGYLKLQQELHRDPDYGIVSVEFAPGVKRLMDQTGAKSISDYGAGKQKLRTALHDLGVSGFDYFPYDPAFPEYGPPKPADIVCCFDVLEHIEPEFLEAVLLDLHSITRRFGFFSITSLPAVKTLSDGRNAHLIQEPAEWWLNRLQRHFEIAYRQLEPHGFWVITRPKTGPS